MEGGALRRFCRLFMPFLIALAALQFQESEQLRTSISEQDARWPYSQDVDLKLPGIRRSTLPADGIHRPDFAQVDCNPLRMGFVIFAGEVWIEIRITLQNEFSSPSEIRE
jgi:hypothetical protein